MKTVSVRQAVLSDLDELAALFDQFRQFQGQGADLAAARTFLGERFNHGESVIFIAHDGGVPVGFAQLYPSFSSVSLSRVFVLNDLFVNEVGRRKGVASSLLSALEAYAWAFGSARITLNVARSNVGGQQLYAARGWQRDEQFFMYHRFP
ncbi:MAG: GNAT family N-acetyltransferase [Burkholderiales bacterium]|nr:GNAT family N-acetyltransferase [Burkholderiales bacterium]